MQVEGVNSVVNNIEILPTSFHDDRIRLAVARSIFSNSVLDRYAWGANPPIHIIVRNGDVTLEGVVNREMERNVAGLMANGVSGVFSVTNNLRLDSR
jgi:hyperosmotically inducible protein